MIHINTDAKMNFGLQKNPHKKTKKNFTQTTATPPPPSKNKQKRNQPITASDSKNYEKVFFSVMFGRFLSGFMFEKDLHKLVFLRVIVSVILLC